MSAYTIAHDYKCFDVFHMLLEKLSFYHLLEHEWFHDSPLSLWTNNLPLKERNLHGQNKPAVFLVIHHLPYLRAMEFFPLFSQLVIRAIGHRSSCLMGCPCELAPVSLYSLTGEKWIHLLCLREHMFWPPLLKLLQGLSLLWLDRLNWICFLSKDSSIFFSVGDLFKVPLPL